MVTFFISLWNAARTQRSSTATTRIFVDRSRQGRNLAGASLSLSRVIPPVLFHQLLPLKGPQFLTVPHSSLNIYSIGNRCIKLNGKVVFIILTIKERVEVVFLLTFVGGEGLFVIVFLLNLKTDTLNAGRGWKCIYNSHAMPLGQNLAFLYSMSVSA